MAKIYVVIALLSIFCRSNAAIDLPVEALESRLKFKDGSELDVRSNGAQLVSAKLTFRGKVHVLTGKVLDGIAQPDLTSIKLKLVSINDCADPKISCLNYSTPLIEIAVGEIPEDRECAEDCVVKFVVSDHKVFRRTSSRKAGELVQYPQLIYPEGE